jgi:hypothetical protein
VADFHTRTFHFHDLCEAGSNSAYSKYVNESKSIGISRFGDSLLRPRPFNGPASGRSHKQQQYTIYLFVLYKNLSIADKQIDSPS